MPFAFSLLAITAYTVASFIIVIRLNAKRLSKSPSVPRKWPILLSLTGIVFHLIAILNTTFTSSGIDFGLFSMMSVISWMICLLVCMICMTNPMEHLSIIALPLACIVLVIKMLYPDSTLIHHSQFLKLHITLSLMAYSLISLSAIQAILLSIQNNHLHNRNPTGFIRILPPLRTMEKQLFQLLMIGFATLTLSLASGFIFLEDMFAQHVAHKTILSIIAWIGFAVLLWGHYRFGWRGKTATRWTLAGSVILMLAYLGSKMVSELIL